MKPIPIFGSLAGKKVFFLMKEGGKRKSGQMKMRSLDEKGIKIEKKWKWKARNVIADNLWLTSDKKVKVNVIFSLKSWWYLH